MFSGEKSVFHYKSQSHSSLPSLLYAIILQNENALFNGLLYLKHVIMFPKED
ncbi:AraC family transcriptional regulator [Streptococcus suis]|nr:AraC family transcriptional regulator [Streptococcus suis]